MSGPDFSRRSMAPELMDTETVSFEEFHSCLRQLEFINICTFAYRPTLQWLHRMWQDIPSNQTIFILDTGSGGGDMLRRIWAWSQMHGLKAALMGVDLNPWSKKSAEKTSPLIGSISFETADIFSLDLPQPPDFIISSLFTHHLNDNELVDFLRWMDTASTRGWFVNDLHRHPVAYYFIKYATQLIPLTNRMIKNDAPISIARSFTASEWRELLAKAGISESRTCITWHFPFRYSVACKKL